MISVRQTRDLPWASFRFHITVDTLAFSYVLTATWSHSGLSPVRVRPCWANQKNLQETLQAIFSHTILKLHPMVSYCHHSSLCSIIYFHFFKDTTYMVFYCFYTYVQCFCNLLIRLTVR